jgi:hypothetical protein
MQTRVVVRSEPTQRMVVHDTSNPAAGMNPVELGFSLLSGTLLNRPTGHAGVDLKATGLAFIDYGNRTRPKPFRWTDHRKPPTAFSQLLLPPARLAFLRGVVV